MKSNWPQLALQNRLHQQRLEEEHGAGQIADTNRLDQSHTTRKLQSGGDGQHQLSISG